jgi:peptidoglycan/LPS O-acetylase OafA/YrhL
MNADPEAAGDNAVVPRWPKWRWTRSPTLGEEFDPRSNALNAWRLALATGVILWHSWLVTGRRVSFEPVHQLLRDGWVDGFFTISGFLITWSWFRRPRIRDYFLARGLRILPGLWACLIVTAFVIAPIAVSIQGGSAVKLLLSSAPFEYVLKNSAVLMLKRDIGGTPSGVPWPGDWDSSLWTLLWEVLCYIAIAGFGVAGLLRRRWVIPALLALALWSSVQLGSFVGLVEAPPDARAHMDLATTKLVTDAVVARFALMFLAGALLYQIRNVIPARWSLVAVSVVIVLAASLLPNYRLIAAVPLAYAIIVSGALIHNKHLRLRTDLSYGVYIYAWPMQELLVICGLAFLNPIVFAIIATTATLPLAALSWFLVEKPVISLKSRLGRKSAAAAGERQQPG